MMAFLPVAQVAAEESPGVDPDCTIIGTSGPDVLAGTAGADVICGRGGDDRLLGRGGDDRLIGGRGDDLLKGGEGQDFLGGGRGQDTLSGLGDAGTRDVLHCGPGNADRASADPVDVVRASCEDVTQNDPPTDLSLAPATVAENEPVGTVVGQLTATDPDPQDTHQFLLVPGAGATDNTSFTLAGRTLRTTAVFDHESDDELSIRVRATDRAGAAYSESLSISVTDVFENADPIAVDDTFATSEDATLVLPVTGAGSPAANDTDGDGDTLTVSDVADVSGGSVSITAGTVRFVPTGDLCGAAAAGFDYTVSDGRGGTDLGRATVDVSCVPDNPTATDDAATVAEDAAATAIPVLANDADPDGDPLAITSVTQPAHGTVVVTGGGTGLTYRPDADYCNDPSGAADTFTYTLTPGGSTATVSMTVPCQDDAPTAIDDSATVVEDAAAAAVDVLANDTDPDGGSMTIASVTQSDNGTVVITGGGTGLTYRPDADYCNDPGAEPADTFTYMLNGGSTATVSVTVTCVPDAPVAVDDEATVAEDSGATAILVRLNDTDVDGGPMTIESASDPANGTVVVAGDGLSLTYEPDADYCNTPPGDTPDTFTYQLNGGAEAAVSITVTCADDEPSAVDDSATVSEDSGATAIPVRSNDTDVDGGPMTIESASDPANGTVAIAGDGLGLTYVPDADYCDDGAPADTFTYTLNGSSTATVSVTVTCVDDDPVAIGEPATVGLNSSPTALDVLANDTDVDGGPMTIVSASDPANGTVVVAGDGLSLTYEPDADYCNTPPGDAPDTFTYQLNGGSEATVAVTVTCDAPPVAIDDSATVAEDASAAEIDVLANDTDSDGGPMEVDSVTQPDHGTVVITGGGSELTYSPDANYCNDPPGTSTDTFTYTLNGGSTATVSVTVTCVDDPPVAVNDSKTVDEDAAATAVDVLANDTDVDGGAKTVASVTQPANGAVVIAGAGTGLSYAPDADYCNDPPDTDPDTFSYTLNGGSTATVSIKVTCAPDAPTLDNSVGPTTYAENDPAEVIDNGVSINNPDGLTITSGSVEITGNFESGADVLDWTDNNLGDAITEGASTASTVVLTGDGTAAEYVAALREVTYRNTSDSPSTLTRTVTFTVITSAGSPSDTIGITVAAVNDPPTAVDDAGATDEDTTLNGSPPGVLSNDTDVDAGDTKTVVQLNGSGTLTGTSTEGGPVTINANGSYTYAPPAAFQALSTGQSATDTFTYTMADGAGAESVATVNLAVDGVSDAPTAAADSFDGIGNTGLFVGSDRPAAQAGREITGSVLTNDTDPDTPNASLVAVAETKATSGGGSVTIEADGNFSFQPDDGDTTDSFTYTVSDGIASADGTVTVTMTGQVWYVKNNQAPGGDGTSDTPFDTLAEAETASGASDTTFVFDGDDTTTNLVTGYALDAGERLVGEISGLSLDPDGGGPLPTSVLHPGTAGARPTLTATGEDVVALDDGNTVRGLQLDPQGAGGGIAGAAGDTGGGTIADVRIIDTGAVGTEPGLELVATTGTWDVSDLSVTTNGAIGVRLNNAGTVNFLSAGTNSISTTGAKGFEAIGPTTSLGADSVIDSITVLSSSAGGVAMTGTTGKMTLGDGIGVDVNLATTGGTAFLLSDAGTVSVPAAGTPATPTAKVSATNGPAVDVTGTTVTALSFDDVDSANSTTDGVNLAGLGSGTFTAGTGSVITLSGSSNGVAFDLDGGSGDVTYGGTITASGNGRTVEVTGRTGALVDLNGQISDTGKGISLSANGAGTVRFDGGITASTGSNTAFSATGSGTVVTTNTNTLTSTTGTALSVNNTTIGGAGLTFRSISSNGAANGIALVNTGTSGGLTVTGTGAAGTGGTIQNTTSDAILLTSTQATSLSFMNVNASQESGILGSGVTDLDLTSSTFANNGDDSGDVGIKVTNLLGTSDWSNLSVTGSELANVLVTNSSGTLNALNVTGASHFDSLGTTFGANSFLLEITGTAVLNSGLIDGATFVNNKPARAVTVQAQGDGTIGTGGNAFVVQNSTFTNNGVQASFEQSGTADLTFKLLDNGTVAVPMTMPNTGVGTSHAVNVFSSSTSTGGTINGRISRNKIGNSAVAGSGSATGNGIRSLIQGRTDATLLYDGNIIRQTPLARGIDIQFLGPLAASPSVIHDVTVINNDVTPQDSTGFPASAIYVAADSQSSTTVTVRADIRNNTVPSGAAFDSLPTFLALDEVVANAVCQLVDSAAASANATAELTSTNTGSASAAAGCALIAGPIGTPP
jgi:VCBS repeat-containing protein